MAPRGSDLLRRAAGALRGAIATKPEDAYYHANIGRVLTAQALLRPPEATPEGARAAFVEAVARDPVNAQVMDQASNALLRLGHTSEARAMALRAATLYPNLAQPMAFFGYAALLDQRWRDAADTLQLAVNREWWEEHTARATTWSNLAAAYLALGRDEEARRAAEEALTLDPSNKDAEANRNLALEGIAAAAAAKPGKTAGKGGSPQ